MKISKFRNIAGKMEKKKKKKRVLCTDSQMLITQVNEYHQPRMSDSVALPRKDLHFFSIYLFLVCQIAQRINWGRGVQNDHCNARKAKSQERTKHKISAASRSNGLSRTRPAGTRRST